MKVVFCLLAFLLVASLFVSTSSFSLKKNKSKQADADYFKSQIAVLNDNYDQCIKEKKLFLFCVNQKSALNKLKAEAKSAGVDI